MVAAGALRARVAAAAPASLAATARVVWVSQAPFHYVLWARTRDSDKRCELASVGTEAESQRVSAITIYGSQKC